MSGLVLIVIAVGAGALADRIGRPAVPYGGAACALAALIVGVLVALPLGDLGPHLLEVAVIPAAIGALAGAFGLRAVLRRIVAQGG